MVFGVDERVLWSNGLAAISAVDNLPSDVQYFKTRYYLLSLLLVCCSGPIQQAAHEISPFLQFLTNKRCPNLKCLVFSLLNSVLSFDCDGYMVPYANNIHRNGYVDRFYKVSLEVLLVLT